MKTVCWLAVSFLLFFSLTEFIISQNEVPHFPIVNYKTVVFKNSTEFNKFIKEHQPQKFNKIKYRVITTLNRKELRYFRLNQKIVVPDTYIDDLRAYSVFPLYYEGAKDIPKLILVSNVYQCYACYEFGNLVRFAAANTGKKTTPTYPGRYSLYWRERLRRSSFNDEWVMPFTWNFHLLIGAAFHQFAMPGYPVSHSCIRQFKEDAEWLFNWGEGAKYKPKTGYVPFSGTPVIIIDFFDFVKSERRWLDLTSNQLKIQGLPPHPLEVEEALIPIQHVPPEFRNLLSKKDFKRYKYAEDTLKARGVLPKNIRLTPSKSLQKNRTKDTSKVTQRAKQP